ncbi:phosphatidylglycerophosphatase A [Vulcanibacillus modesticaldus]|uniref:Phosphatidylglycerophosphatase A n=1 Tax=Vulcanibacillus modesticaldus TaxID=337097 RepID=A0A1D2YWC6_9BACI|nr:phosphatidylglycerophosphatase A [Vulcanibacillus modesticaldus]OEG00051.1 phosphatidylglycerophosphatase A [Vulcanibacillus modesticaldus]
MKKRVSSEEVKLAALKRLKDRGVTLEDIAKIVYEMQVVYNRDLTMEQCLESVQKVLEKREIQHAILVGVELDILAEKKLLQEPLQTIIETDEGLFGVDETLAIGLVYGYGSIALTTFGYLDKDKIGIIKKLDTKNGKKVHTFLDDLVAGIAASASGRIAHLLRDVEEGEEKRAKENDEKFNEINVS